MSDGNHRKKGSKPEKDEKVRMGGWLGSKL